MRERSFKMPMDYYETGVNIYATEDFTFKSGVTVLVGCNGAGKSTLMRQMQRDLEDKSIQYIAFDNIKDGRTTARQEALGNGNIEFLAQSIMASEGEDILLNIGRMASKIGRYARSKSAGDELWIFFDAVDSGLSIDNVLEVKRDLFNLILETNQDRDVYIIVSANAYEFASGEQCYDVRSGKYMTFADYEAYKSFVVESRRLKEERYKNYDKKEDKTKRTKRRRDA